MCVAVCISPSVVLERFYGGPLKVHGTPAMVEGGFEGLELWLRAVLRQANRRLGSGGAGGARWIPGMTRCGAVIWAGPACAERCPAAVGRATHRSSGHPVGYCPGGR